MFEYQTIIIFDLRINIQTMNNNIIRSTNIHQYKIIIISDYKFTGGCRNKRYSNLIIRWVTVSNGNQSQCKG